MNNALDWSDYQVVLQIAEAGSLTGAAEAAGVSHPTMFRRINAIEAKLGSRLFERFRSGYCPTAAGEALVETAREIAALTTGAERRMAGRDLRPEGVVRIATTDTLMSALLAPELARLREAEPGILPEVLISNAVTDLTRREADIALRPARAPEPHLVGRRLGVIRQAVYGTAALAGADTPPWIGPGAAMRYEQLHGWMKSEGHDDACVARTDSVLGLHAAARQGIGLAVLPCYLAEPDGALRRIGAPVDEMATDLWLLTHPDLRQTARVRAVLDHIAGSTALREALAA